MGVVQEEWEAGGLGGARPGCVGLVHWSLDLILRAVRSRGGVAERARMFHTWPLGSPSPYLAKMVFLGQALGLACYSHVLWT